MAKVILKTVDKDGKELELGIYKPNSKTYVKSQDVYNSMFASAVKSGAYLRENIDKMLKEQGLWDDDREAKYVQIKDRINNGERKLAAGGIKLSEGRELALDVRRARMELRDLIIDRQKYDSHTAEAQAENARFSYLVSACVVYNESGDPFFKSYDDYLERADEKATEDAAAKFASIYYNVNDDFDHTLPENKFLKKYKFVDEKLRFINKDGQLVDIEGRLVDDEGRYIKYVDGVKKFVDVDGNEVDAEGNYIAEFSPFLDDDGNPIMDEEDVKEEVLSSTK